MQMRIIGKILVLAIAARGIVALSVAQTVQKPAFEVASIKLNTSGVGGVALDAGHGKFLART